MTKKQQEELAETIVSFQHIVAQLPAGKGYGYVPIHDQGEFQRWGEIVERDLSTGLPNVQKLLSVDEIEAVVQKLKQLAPYFDNVKPVCFLDDLTTKNVILQRGELQGIVDLDCVCYGDPLYMIALTQTAIIADLREPDLFYVDELCRAWNLTEEQRNLVDFYSLLFAMNFLAYFGDDVSGYKRTCSYVKKWIGRMQ